MTLLKMNTDGGQEVRRSMTDLYGLMNDDGDLETVKLHCVTLRKEGRNRKLRTVYTISVPNEVVIHL